MNQPKWSLPCLPFPARPMRCDVILISKLTRYSPVQSNAAGDVSNPALLRREHALPHWRIFGRQLAQRTAVREDVRGQTCFSVTRSQTTVVSQARYGSLYENYRDSWFFYDAVVRSVCRFVFSHPSSLSTCFDA